MRTPPDHPPPPAVPTARDRGDACPGTLRLHAADDGALARVRIPGGVLRLDQAGALGRAARDLGDGELHLTSRGNVQLRGLDAGCVRELAARLDAAGLLPSHRNERVRNIVASPLSGLDGRGHLDVRQWLGALDRMLCGSEAAGGLSGRFLFALDDGRGDVAALAADVTLRAAPDGGARLLVGDTGVLHVDARDVQDAPRLALLAAEAFLEAADGRAWRVSELPGGVGEVVRLLRGRGVPAAVGARPAMPVGHAPPPGVVTGSGGADPDGATAISVLAPLGRFSAAQWAELTAAAHRELRLTPWRGAVLPGSPAAALTRLAAAGLITDSSSPLLGVGACVGHPGCARSLADVRADAALHTGGAPRTGGALPVYWSGCDRRCGRPRGDHVDVVAAPGGYGVAVVRGGRHYTGATIADPSELAAAVAAARVAGLDG
ncbi:precorrin-3B synthase [Nocardiopsis mwathae]|uniref:Precorrin-3B synthase n=1 Tax=Nocardiopsis mwathae TaxID=1472723 RepID=A0A7W9YM37_9ACTN|nr:precorrin-3B synthase [Nocardiopsis mwathae]